MNGKTRVDWVDAAKGLCIVFVVMMHSTLGVEKSMGETGWLGTVVAFAQPFRMPDFFLISGLFLSRVVSRDWRTFIDRRIIHFVYFYVLWLTIQFAFKTPGFIAEFGLAGTAVLFLKSLVLEPFGTLWFIWILPFFALAVRLTRNLPVPLVFAAAALLEMAPITTGHLVVDETASRFVYFYAGYAFAPAIFAFADRVADNRRAAVVGLLAWGTVNGALVFSGLSHLPLVSLALGIAGACAIVAAAVLIAATARLGDLARFVGSRSIVVYLSFFLPMAASRAVLLKAGIITDVGTISALVTLAGVTVPFALHVIAMRTGARFLFERPDWAKIERPQPTIRVKGLVPAE